MKRLLIFVMLLGITFSMQATADFNCENQCCVRGGSHSATVDVTNGDTSIGIIVYKVEIRTTGGSVFGSWSDAGGFLISPSSSHTFSVPGTFPNDYSVNYDIWEEYGNDYGQQSYYVGWTKAGSGYVTLYSYETCNPSYDYDNPIDTSANFQCQDSCCFPGDNHSANINVENDNSFKDVKIKKIELRTTSDKVFANLSNTNEVVIPAGEQDTFEVTGTFPQSGDTSYKRCVYWTYTYDSPGYQDSYSWECESDYLNLQSRTAYECQTNDNCEENEYCDIITSTSCYSKCRELEPKGCQEIEKHTLVTYQCCDNLDCQTGWVCVNHECQESARPEVTVENECHDKIIVTVTDPNTGNPVTGGVYVTVDNNSPLPVTTDGQLVVEAEENSTYQISVYVPGRIDNYETEYTFSCEEDGGTNGNGGNGGTNGGTAGGGCTSNRDCASNQYCSGGSFHGIDECQDYEIENPETAEVGEEIQVTVTRCGRPAGDTTVTITDPKEGKTTSRTDNQGKTTVSADFEGTYGLSISKNGRPIKSSSLEVSKGDSDDEDQERRGIFGGSEFTDNAILLVLVFIIVVGLVLYLRGRGAKGKEQPQG